MNDKQRRLYDCIKARYDAYLQDKIKHDLYMFVLRKEDMDVLQEIGYKRTPILMRSEVPTVLKAFESAPTKHEQMALF